MQMRYIYRRDKTEKHREIKRTSEWEMQNAIEVEEIEQLIMAIQAF